MTHLAERFLPLYERAIAVTGDPSACEPCWSRSPHPSVPGSMTT